MSKLNEIERLLKEYKISKARIVFIESQINRISCNGTNEHKGDNSSPCGFISSLPTTTFMLGRDGMKQGLVNEGCSEYRSAIQIDYGALVPEMEFELKRLKYSTGLVEDALDILDGLDRKQKMVVERFYISGHRMEDIAYDVHISRSRCYELCKEALEVLENVIYGRYLGAVYKIDEVADQISLFDENRQKITLKE